MRPAGIPGAALALALLLAACGGPAGESAPPSAPAETSTPAETPIPTAQPIPTGGPYVYTDDSHLEDRAPQRDIYRRWYGAFTGELIPSPDYGFLIPFSGAPLADEWGYGGYALRGLMTLEGEVVVDPVYTSVTRLCSSWDWDAGESPEGYYPAYLLSRYAGDGDQLFDGYRDVLSRLCAVDGSWVTEREYRFSYDAQVHGVGVYDGAIFALRDGSTLCLLDVSTGEELFSASLDGLDEDDLGAALNNAYYGDGRVTLSVPIFSLQADGSTAETGYLRCWDISGEEIPLPDDVDSLRNFSEGLCPARRTGGEGYAWGYLGLDGAWAIPPQFTYSSDFEDGVALVGSNPGQSLIDRAGNVLVQVPAYDLCQQTGDYWYFIGYSGDVGLVLDKNGNEVNSPLLHGGVVEALSYSWAIMPNSDGSFTLAKGEKSWVVPEAWNYTWRSLVTEDTVCFAHFSPSSGEGGEARWAIWRPETEEAPTFFPGNLFSFDADLVTGERYFVVLNDDGLTYRVADSEGWTLFDGLPYGNWMPALYDGRCLLRWEDGGYWTQLLDKNGAVLFSRRWEDPFD